jgi:hypothetical protein
MENVGRRLPGWVPEIRTGGDDSLIWSEEGVELPGESALGDGEREPACLGPERIAAGRRMKLVVWVMLGQKRPPLVRPMI